MKIIRPTPVLDTGTFTRSTTATYYDSAGALQTAAINTPRFSYNPASLSTGPILLIESAATNMYLNSATITTQTITVSAGSYTFSMSGSGSVVISGVGTSSLVTTGLRGSTTFTTTSGSLVITLASGAPTLGQLEVGIKATSYIPTTGTSVTRAADVNSLALVSNVPENDYPVWNSGTTYALGDNVLVLSSHKIYQSSVAGNLNHPPPNTAYWIDAGSDNRWRLFDQSITSQTSQAGNITVALTPGSRLDSVVGLNCSAATATINMVDPILGIVYSKQFVLTGTSGITDWYAYFYEPIVQITEFIATDLPVSYSGATTTVSISITSGNASAGGLVFGLSKEIGYSEWNTKIGTVDYSVKTKDAFGNYNIVPRNFSKRADFSIKVPTDQVDSLQNLLASYRSIPVVYVGSNAGATQQFNSTIIYGFYKDFSIDIAYSSFSTCTMQVEGLT